MVATPEPDPPLFPTNWWPAPASGRCSRPSSERLLADYREACAWSRATAAGHALDDVALHSRMGEVSLRWI